MKNRKLQIGIIGGGMIAERHMNNFKMDERTEILWVADIEYNTLKRIASRFDVPNSTRDYREMLKDHNLDAVVVCTPPDSHCRIGLDVMRAGKHLMMEKPLAVKAGLGWMGKHTNVLSQDAGSWFFLGEIYTNLPLKASQPVEEHCGDCVACIDICPTKAIIKPYKLDARRCISYLTIEHKGVIAEEFREAIGNRIYGCDDCQLVCPWNRFASDAEQADFAIRNNLDSTQLLTLFAWTETEFLKNMEGSPIRRIGFERWQRNIAIALGNAPTSPIIIKALEEKYASSSDVVQEHINWALQRLK